MNRERLLRKTKVIATIGPACDSEERIRELIEAGMNVARLNLSHGTLDDHRERIARVRAASESVGVHVAVMLDTRGVEIRTGPMAGGSVELRPGDAFELTTEERAGDASGVSVSYERLPHEVRLGSSILLDDGRIELKIESLSDTAIRCQVMRGGELGSLKGVNVPDAALTLDTLSPENERDLRFAAEVGVDYIAASFMRSAKDVLEIRRLLEAQGTSIPIMAKIENREGVANLEEIVAEADGTMVARGDLGVELPVEQVPLIQKKIIRTTVGNGKPVVTATQMLDSMERNARPTRAEASDVANAILDGTSAVMLSGETAKGRHPVAAVRTMSRVAMEAEAALRDYGDLQQILPPKAHVVTDAVAQAAIGVATQLGAAAIVSLTESGFTARSVSKYRPDCPNLAVTTSLEVARKLAMNWGVTGLLYTGEGGDEDKVRFGIQRGKELGAVETGDLVVVTAGTSRESGSTNVMRVVTAE
ncbi:MAG: pyruvate kinase [Proteobacteria bacterium]|nr:pyruvate kinase [Pseudomonadota bacterium]